jgi:hypothetical protein
MKCKTKEKIPNASNNEALEISFEEYDKKYNIKLRYPPREGMPGFPVTRVGAFRWITPDEVKIVQRYAERKKGKALRIGLNVALYRLSKRLHR